MTAKGIGVVVEATPKSSTNSASNNINKIPSPINRKKSNKKVEKNNKF